MPFWTFGSIEQEPQVQLVRWRVLEASYVDKAAPLTRHLVGANAASGTGRVSSAIQQIDAGARMCLTRSGRAYGLLGESSYDSAADYVWAMWCRINGVVSWVDVTEDAFAADNAEMTVRDIKPSTRRDVQ